MRRAQHANIDLLETAAFCCAGRCLFDSQLTTNYCDEVTRDCVAIKMLWKLCIDLTGHHVESCFFVVFFFCFKIAFFRPLVFEDYHTKCLTEIRSKKQMAESQTNSVLQEGNYTFICS